MFMLSLPFPIKNIDGHRYYTILLNRIEYFNLLLLVVFIVSVLFELIDFGFPYATILSRGWKNPY